MDGRIKDILLSEIDRSGNYRIPMPGDAERIEALKQSIEACGQLQPIRVYERGPDQKEGRKEGKYILGFGARRCAAMDLLDRKTIRAIVFEPATNAQIAQARAVENLHRQDITPLEEVKAVSDVLEAIKAQKDFTGDPYEEVATRLARSVAWVKDRDYLHRLSKPVQRFAMRSGLPAGHLRELAKVGDPREQMRLACESVGAPSWAFPAGDKDTGVADHQQQLQQGYFAQLADGKVERWPLSRLKEQVAKVQLSLRVIPWEFDKSVQLGDMKLRKCAGCPHNSETDRTLFGIDEDAANPQGFCLNPACYNGKHEAAQTAKEEILARISKRSVQTPEAIRKVTPDWLKETSVIGFVKRQLEKASKSNGEVHPERPTEGRGLRILTPLEHAIQQFAGEHDEWEQKASTAVMKGINKEPVHRVSWCVLLGVAGFWKHARYQIPFVGQYGPPRTIEPILPPLETEIEEAVKLAFKGTRNGWLDVLADQKQADPSQRDRFGIPHPRVLQLIAEAVGVNLPPPPQWTPPAAAQPQPSVAEEVVAVAA
jgi:ParB/RepB/Spo0J family partition protein